MGRLFFNSAESVRNPTRQPRSSMSGTASGRNTRSGSELFIVYKDELDTHLPALLWNRALVVKINRVFRF
jgi:hypothetical protein